MLEARQFLSATVTGTVFNDLARNGTLDPADGGMAGWTVFVDADADDTLDAGEPSTTTSGGGAYSLSVDAGTHRLAAVTQPGWLGTTPASQRTVTVADGATATANLGFAAAPPVRNANPVGPRVPVSQNAFTSTEYASIGSDAVGNQVVVWEAGSVVGRRVDAAGNVLGSEFVANTSGNSAYPFKAPRVAVAPDGRFVVAWMTSSNVVVRRFAADGVPLAETVIRPADSGLRSPEVAIDANGNYAVMWGEGFSSRSAVRVQMFNWSGAPLSTQVRVDEAATFGAQHEPGGILVDSAGRVTLAYSDGAGRTYGRRFFANGGMDGQPFLIDEGAGNARQEAAVAVNAAGDRLFAWTRGTRVYGRLYGPDNAPRGGVFPIGTSAPSGDALRVAAAPDGFFMVVWSRFVGTSGQLVSPEGVPNGREIVISTSGRGAEVAPASGDTFATLNSRFAGGLGIQRFEMYTGGSSVSGVFFDDRDRDGIRDAGEAGIPNLEVRLNDEFGTLISFTRTDAAGRYQFDFVKSGAQYTLTATLNVNSAYSPMNQGADETVDSDFDPATRGTPVFTAPADGGSASLDAGVIDLPPSVVQVGLGSTTWTAAYRQGLSSNGVGWSSSGLYVKDAEQGKPLPSLNLNQITIHFNEAVNVTADQLVLNGVNVASYGLAATGGFSASGSTATWTLAQPISADKLLLSLHADADAGVTDAIGQRLDGEWTNPAAPAASGDTYPSGDGVEGGDFNFRVNVLPGDVDRNGVVNSSDVDAVRALEGTSAGGSTFNNRYNALLDIDGSGAINSVDTAAVQSRLGGELPSGEPAGTPASLPGWVSGAAAWDAAAKVLTITGPATLLGDPGGDLPAVTVSGPAAVLTISAPMTRVASLALADGGVAALTASGVAPQAASGRHTLIVENADGLSVTGAGSKLDVGDNAVVLRNTSLSAVQALVTSGNNGGTWTGGGITSGTAAADAGGSLAVGYASGTQRPGAFQGVGTIGANDVMLRLTYDGDTDLDGLVNTDDILNILSGGKLDLNVAATWYDGDFTFDNRVNTDDILEILAGGRLDA